MNNLPEKDRYVLQQIAKSSTIKDIGTNDLDAILSDLQNAGLISGVGEVVALTDNLHLIVTTITDKGKALLGNLTS